MLRNETRRKEGRKNGSGQRTKPSTPTQPTDARMGEEEKNKKHGRKETGSGPPTSYLDHLVGSYYPHRSYGDTFAYILPHLGRGMGERIGLPYAPCVSHEATESSRVAVSFFLFSYYFSPALHTLCVSMSFPFPLYKLPNIFFLHLNL